MIRFLLIVYCALCIVHSSSAQLNPVTITIPMRDGKFLAADVYLPNNDSTPRPTILIQTPYNKDLYTTFGLPLRIAFAINASPYNFVIADWRCFHASAPACTTNFNRGEDGYDCVEWIATQSWSNGSVGTWGPSALGIIQFQTARQNPPHLTCCVPIVSGMRTDYQRYFPGGVFRTEYVQMLDILGYGLSALLLAHPVHDIYWQISENNTFYPDSIQVPMFMIGGWYDHATEEVLESFDGIRTQSALPVRAQHKLLMGPWTHNLAANGGAVVGELNYPQAQGKSDSLARIFCDYHLLGAANGWNNRSVVEYFQLGENTWKNDSSWNSTGITGYQLYLHPDSSLTLSVPAASTGSMTLSYDPHDPSPTVGGPVLLIGLDQGPYDQQPFVESRNDILSFSTAPLAQDVVLRGRPTVHIRFSSDRTDTDFSIRLTDVYPDGRSMLVQDGIRRARFRNGYEAGDTSAIIPGVVYDLDIDFFESTAITFLAGHRIRVDITSSNYPRFDSNLNNGGPMYTAGDTLIAFNTVYMNSTDESFVTLPLENFPDDVSEFEQSPNLILYPNPSDGYVTIGGLPKVSGELTTYRIYNSVGAEVSSGFFTNPQNRVPTAGLRPGLYSIRVENGRQVVTGKLVVAE